MTEEKKRSFHAGWACIAILCFGLAGGALWIFFDGYASGELPNRGGGRIRKTGHEAEFDLAAGKFMLVAAAFAAFGVHATAKAFGGKGDEVLFPDK